MSENTKEFKIVIPEGYEIDEENSTFSNIVFKKKESFITGKDYVNKTTGTIVIDTTVTGSNAGFYNGRFCVGGRITTPNKWRKAKHKEVVEAFKKELISRYGEGWENTQFKKDACGVEQCPSSKGKYGVCIEKDVVLGWEVWNKNGLLYRSGRWAEKLEKPKREDIGEVEGCVIDNNSTIHFIKHYNPSYPDSWVYDNNSTIHFIKPVYTTNITHSYNKNLWPSKEEAEAALALSQLCQWRDRYNKGWKPDFKDSCDIYAILFSKEEPIVTTTLYIGATLSFKTEEIAHKFLEDFKELIIKAKPLL